MASLDKSWLLNPKAIQAAKHCILLTEQELGVKLKLSHPDFLTLLCDYCELTDSEPLAEAFNTLIDMAGDDIKKALSFKAAPVKVTPINKAVNFFSSEPPVVNDKVTSESTDEMIEYSGRSYQKWKDGLEFKGLYRGQPRYA